MHDSKDQTKRLWKRRVSDQRFWNSFAAGCCLLCMPISGIGASFADCAGVIDDNIEGLLLTRDEKIALLEQRYYESLAAFNECLNTGVADSTDSSSGGEAGAAMNAVVIESIPITGIRGTEPAAPDSEINAADENVPELTGKIPEDIPLADNDSALQAQIRRAAMNEQDPIIKERLWDEYRKHKGLPPKDVSVTNATITNDEEIDEENN